MTHRAVIAKRLLPKGRKNVFEWFRLGGMGAGPPLSNIGRSPGLPKHSLDLGFPKSRICILPLRGGLGGVNVSFSSFLCAKEKDRLVAGRVVKNGRWYWRK